MTTVSVDASVFEDLVNFRMNHLIKTIEEILANWEEKDIDEFINKARSGIIPHAEMDAISLRQLQADLENYRKILKEMKVEN